MATVNKRKPTREEKRKILNAAATGDVNTIQVLASSGVDVTGSLDWYNETALHRAAANGHFNVVAYLLSHGARVNDVTSINFTALHRAAEHGHYNVVAYLLSHGAGVNDVTSYNQWTPLHFAAYNGYAEIADLLVKNGASVSIKDKKNRTPLQLAVEKSKSNVVLYFIKQQNMDITQFDNETQLKIGKLVEKAERKQGQNTKNKAKLRILHSLSKAREDGCLIKVRYGKVLICGASEAGKTNFLNLLMEDEFQAKHISTAVGEPKRTIAMKAQVSESSKKIVFTKLDIDQEIDLLKLYLPEKYINQSHSTQDDMSDVQKKCTIVEHVISETVVENIYSEQETLPTQQLTDSEKILPTEQPTNSEKSLSVMEGEHLKATPSMKQLQEVTRKTNFAARWEELGTSLEVGCNIPVIKKDNSNDSRGGCHELFNTWLEMDTNASWDKLVSALRNIGMDADAQVVSEYCKSVYMKCSDRVPKASCSIQEPELQIIKDFLKSVDSRFDKSQPSLVTPKLPPVEPQPSLLTPELPPVEPQPSLLTPKLPPIEPELPLATVEPLPKTSFVADENAPVEPSLLAPELPPVEPELPLVEPELRPVKPLSRTNIVADENALQEKPIHKMLSRITSFLTDHWRRIAYELLQPQDVKSIESTTKSNDDKCLDVLIKWLETDPSASYSKLIEALNELDLSSAADNVKKKILNNY